MTPLTLLMCAISSKLDLLSLNRCLNSVFYPGYQFSLKILSDTKYYIIHDTIAEDGKYIAAKSVSKYKKSVFFFSIGKQCISIITEISVQNKVQDISV